MKVTLWTILFSIVAVTMGCAQHAHNLPPAERLMEPGPGVGGPGPGVIAPVIPAGVEMVGQHSVQVLFEKPQAMQIRWDVGGIGMFDSEPLVVPGRTSFPEGGIYRLKLTGIEGREAVELYPTIEVGPTTPRTEAFLAHNAIPIHFTPEDFDQVASGNFVTKVVYLPDPEFQELALSNVDTLVSTRLDPGIDPVVEADRRGSIMAIIRMGNKDLELPGEIGEGGVIPAGYSNMQAGMACSTPMPGYPGMGGGYAGMMPGPIAGVTAPHYGMPITGTPIGLPGPPHIPLGGPAGLQQHTIRNHTPMHIPDPVSKFKVHVRQQPGYSYPKPPSRMHIREQNIHPPIRYGQSHHAQRTLVD